MRVIIAFLREVRRHLKGLNIASRGIGRTAPQPWIEGVKVAVSSRNQILLATRNAQPKRYSFPLDVTNQRATLRSLRAMSERLCGIDLAVLNAGIHEHTDVRTFSAATAARIMAVNYLESSRRLRSSFL